MLFRKDNNNNLMVVLQSKFGYEHKRESYRMELRYRAQKAKESLQSFAFGGRDNFKTYAFVNGLHDPDIKRGRLYDFYITINRTNNGNRKGKRMPFK